MKVAVIGIGKMGMLHAGIMNGLKNVSLCAVSDSSKFLLGAAQGIKKGLAIYEDYRTMLDEMDPDIGIIATPVFLHIPMALDCVERGIPFFLEKPLCTRSRDAEELLKER